MGTVSIQYNCPFTLPNSDTDTNSDSDSKPNGYIALCRTFHIAQNQTLIPTPYLCLGQESEFEAVPQSISGNVIEP